MGNRVQSIIDNFDPLDDNSRDAKNSGAMVGGG
jgi:hypothetical protein